MEIHLLRHIDAEMEKILHTVIRLDPKDICAMAQNQGKYEALANLKKFVIDARRRDLDE